MALEIRFAIPGQALQTVPLVETRVVVGTLLSNHIVLRVSGVDPIHAMFEQHDSGEWRVVDLGSVGGVFINGQRVEVERSVKAGDRVRIAAVDLLVSEVKGEALVVDGPVETLKPTAAVAQQGAGGFPSRGPIRGGTGTGHVATASGRSGLELAAKVGEAEQAPKRRRDVLFSPRKARPTGDVLEVVAHWGDTVLEVDHFHPKLSGFETVTIGDPTKAHFIAAGEGTFSLYPLAKVKERGYSIRMLPGMEARIRKDGAVEKVEGEAKLSLGSRDFAQIKYGPVKYFMMFVNPPNLALPRSGPRDVLFTSLMFGAITFFVLLMTVLSLTPPKKEELDKDDIWAIANVPETQKPPVKVELPKPKIEEAKVPPPPPQEPPKPQPSPVKPAKPVEVEKPKQKTPVEKPVEKAQTAQALTPPKPQPQEQAAGDKSNSATKTNQGMASTGAKSPDFKLAGPQTKAPLGAAGGAKGAGMNQQGGERKGNQNASVRGVEGPKNNLASGPNLDKLGIGVGKILSKTGPSAVYTNFQSSAGGAGGGMGSGAKTVGLGGVGTGSSLGVAGVDSGLNNFGSGSGGTGSGLGGTGGLGGDGLGKAFGGGRGKGQASVSVPPGDPVVSGGLSPEEIEAVIRAHLNEIRHCYELLLQRSPNAAGKVAVNFVIGLDGRVQTATVGNSTIDDPIMRGCVTGRVARWKFPNPRGGQSVTVNYPFVFNPV